MRRSEFICFRGCLFFACPCVALAQQSARLTRIGWLSASSPGTPIGGKNLQAFRQSLERLGHIEGRDIAIEFRYAHVNFDRLPSLAAELVEQKVDIIVTVNTQAAVAAARPPARYLSWRFLLPIQSDLALSRALRD